jgi:ribosomal protein S12 methylthiotransferase accessory factor
VNSIGMENASATLRRLQARFVDPVVGVIHELGEVRREADDPRFFYVGARASNTSAFSSQTNFSSGGGASVSRERALLKGIGEAVERYCAALYNAEHLPLFAFNARGGLPCRHPDEWALFSDTQYRSDGFPFVPFNETTRVRWVQGFDVGTGHQAYVPAAMVYVPYTYYLSSGDSPIVQPISTGLACHSTLERAATSALCEVVERDAFMLFWLRGLRMPRLLRSGLSSAALDLVERFERIGCTVDLRAITLDIALPTILAVCRKRHLGRGPALAVAAACAPDIEGAVTKALEELAHTRRYVKDIERLCPRLATGADVRTQEDHLNYWVSADVDTLVPWLTSEEPGEICMTDVPSISGNDQEVWEQSVAAVVRAGYRPIRVDLTTSDVRDFLRIVRVVVPGLHPLVMGSQTVPLGGDRLKRTAEKLGVAAFYPSEEPNPYPHPFP